MRLAATSSRAIWLGLVSLACLTLLCGCGFWPDVSYRYKLTLAVDTPVGLQTASSVVQLDFYRGANGDHPHHAHGQSLVLDLGPRGVLVALVAQIRLGKWSETDPAGIIWDKCGGGYSPDYVMLIENLKNCRGAYVLAPDEQPDLIYFKNSADAQSGALVNSRDAGATLGSNIKLKSVTLQITDEALTHGVDDHLSWARAKDWRLRVPEGDGVGRLHTLVSYGNFIQGE